MTDSTVLELPAEAKFSIGTTSAPVMSKVDMSLDDIMKSRRDEAKTSNLRNTRHKVDPKKLIENAAKNSGKRRVGVRRASKDAATANRRGLRDSKAPTKMEVEKEVKKEMKKTVKFGAGANRKRNELAERGGRKKMTPRGRARPPTQKAIKAAVSAMTNAGFKVPEGMKVVISVEKEPGATQVSGNNKPDKNSNPNANKGGRLWNNGNKNGAGRGSNRNRR